MNLNKHVLKVFHVVILKYWIILLITFSVCSDIGNGHKVAFKCHIDQGNRVINLYTGEATKRIYYVPTLESRLTQHDGPVVAGD